VFSLLDLIGFYPIKSSFFLNETRVEYRCEDPPEICDPFRFSCSLRLAKRELMKHCLDWNFGMLEKYYRDERRNFVQHSGLRTA